MLGTELITTIASRRSISSGRIIASLEGQGSFVFCSIRCVSQNQSVEEQKLLVAFSGTLESNFSRFMNIDYTKSSPPSLPPPRVLTRPSPPTRTHRHHHHSKAIKAPSLQVSHPSTTPQPKPSFSSLTGIYLTVTSVSAQKGAGR